jgi:hypothetical protein
MMMAMRHLELLRLSLSLDAEKFGKALKAIADGRYSVDELKATYSLTKEQEAQL